MDDFTTAVLQPPSRDDARAPLSGGTRSLRVWRLSRATRISTTSSGGSPVAPFTSRSASASNSMACAMRALPSRRDCSSAFFPTNALPTDSSLGRLLAARDRGAVEREHVGVVPVQGEEHLHRAQAPGVGHAVEHAEGGGRIAAVDGVGELVAGDVARFAQVGLEVLDGDAGTRAVGGRQRAQKPFDPARGPPRHAGPATAPPEAPA